ncbi:hypothetical protein JL49_09070 [Pseudoalteromonas luteoviolacea]|nr:hypothetical protein JL49_09070 [Pseudoalteromonas luteoviolacea]
MENQEKTEATEVTQQPENNFLAGRESDAKALEASLQATDEEMDFIPPSPEDMAQSETAHDAVPSENNEMNDANAQGVAFMAIASYEGLLKTFVGPEFELPAGMKQEAVEKYGPLIVKYGPSAIGTFGRYQDEIMAGVFTASLVRESFIQIRKINAQKAVNDDADSNAQDTPETANNTDSEAAA